MLEVDGLVSDGFRAGLGWVSNWLRSLCLWLVSGLGQKKKLFPLIDPKKKSAMSDVCPKQGLSSGGSLRRVLSIRAALEHAAGGGTASLLHDEGHGEALPNLRECEAPEHMAVVVTVLDPILVGIGMCAFDPWPCWNCLPCLGPGAADQLGCTHMKSPISLQVKPKRYVRQSGPPSLWICGTAFVAAASLIEHAKLPQGRLGIGRVQVDPTVENRSVHILGMSQCGARMPGRNLRALS